jgi:hypothetical protein
MCFPVNSAAADKNACWMRSIEQTPLFNNNWDKISVVVVGLRCQIRID